MTQPAVDFFAVARANTLAEAAKIAPKIIIKLPRLEPRYGGSYVAIGPDKTIIGRGFPDFQMAQMMRDVDGVTFYHEVLVDCPHCRRERLAIYNANPNTEYAKEAMRLDLKHESYWCNDCQGTGWYHEEWADTRKRYGILSPEEHAKALSPAALAEHLAGHGATGLPADIIMQEAARRLQSGATS